MTKAPRAAVQSLGRGIKSTTYIASDWLTIPSSLALLIGLSSDEPQIELSRLDLLAGLHTHDRLRIGSMLQEAIEPGGPFEAKFRILLGQRAPAACA